MTKRMFRSIFLVALVVLLLSVALLSVVFYNDYAVQYRSELKSEALSMAHAINGGLAESSYVRLNNRYNSSLADADNAYSDAVNQAYLDMIQANRAPQQGLANARATYQSGLANAPAAKTIRGVKVKDSGNPGAFYDAMNRLGYTDEQIASIWNSRK